MKIFIRFLAAGVFTLFSVYLIVAAIMFVFFKFAPFDTAQIFTALGAASVSLLMLLSTYIEELI